MHRNKSELEVKGKLTVIENYTRMKLHLCGADHTEIIPAVVKCVCCIQLSQVVSIVMLC